MIRRDLTDLLAVLDHQVQEGERTIARQLDIIDLLERGGRDLTEAKELLRSFQELQALHISHRDQIRADIARVTATPAE